MKEINIEYVKNLLRSYYPDSKFVDDITLIRYSGGMLLLETDDQGSVYVLIGDEVRVYKRDTTPLTPLNREKSFDSKLRSILRELQISTIISE